MHPPSKRARHRGAAPDAKSERMKSDVAQTEQDLFVRYASFRMKFSSRHRNLFRRCAHLDFLRAATRVDVKQPLRFAVTGGLTREAPECALLPS